MLQGGDFVGFQYGASGTKISDDYGKILGQILDGNHMEHENDGIVEDKQLIPGCWNAKFNFIFIFQTTNQIFPSLFSFRS